MTDSSRNPSPAKPAWLKKRISSNEIQGKVSRVLIEKGLHTVCEGARCPNKFECFSKGTATFMILGETCSRQCTFCAVPSGDLAAPNPDEPRAVAEAARELGLSYIVVTSVTRDDLPDKGLGQFLETVRQIRHHLPSAKVEILTPDFAGNEKAAREIRDCGPDVFNHNVEVVPRLYPRLRPQAAWDRSLGLLRQVADYGVVTKSSLMLGLGESPDEIRDVFRSLRAHEVSILTLGQYLQPTVQNHPVVEYIHPQQFANYREEALALGFDAVASGPFVRSSYSAMETCQEALRKRLPLEWIKGGLR